MQGALHTHAKASGSTSQPRGGAGAQAASGRSERPRAFCLRLGCFFASIPGGGGVRATVRLTHRPRVEGRAVGGQAAARGRDRGACRLGVGCRLDRELATRIALAFLPGPPHIPRPALARRIFIRETRMATYSANHSVERERQRKRERRECGEERKWRKESVKSSRSPYARTDRRRRLTRLLTHGQRALGRWRTRATPHAHLGPSAIVGRACWPPTSPRAVTPGWAEPAVGGPPRWRPAGRAVARPGAAVSAAEVAAQLGGVAGASCMPAHALRPEAGWTVLDACAAPGNKTTHVAGEQKPFFFLFFRSPPLVIQKEEKKTPPLRSPRC